MVAILYLREIILYWIFYVIEAITATRHISPCRSWIFSSWLNFWFCTFMLFLDLKRPAVPRWEVPVLVGYQKYEAWFHSAFQWHDLVPKAVILRICLKALVEWKESSKPKWLCSHLQNNQYTAVSCLVIKHNQNLKFSVYL